MYPTSFPSFQLLSHIFIRSTALFSKTKRKKEKTFVVFIYRGHRHERPRYPPSFITAFSKFHSPPDEYRAVLPCFISFFSVSQRNLRPLRILNQRNKTKAIPNSLLSQSFSPSFFLLLFKGKKGSKRLFTARKPMSTQGIMKHPLPSHP